jgi:hypothetical protein
VAVAADDSLWPVIAARRSRLIETAEGGEQRAHIRAQCTACVVVARPSRRLGHGPRRGAALLLDRGSEVLKRELASHPVADCSRCRSQTRSSARSSRAEFHARRRHHRPCRAVACRDSAGVPVRHVVACARSGARGRSRTHRRSAGHRVERSAAAARRGPRGQHQGHHGGRSGAGRRHTQRAGAQEIR